MNVKVDIEPWLEELLVFRAADGDDELLKVVLQCKILSKADCSRLASTVDFDFDFSDGHGLSDLEAERALYRQVLRSEPMKRVDDIDQPSPRSERNRRSISVIACE